MTGMICKECGACCRVITMPYSMKQFKRSPEKGENIMFIIDNFVPLSHSKAFTINPRSVRAVAIAKKSNKEIYFYTCKQFDEATNKCKDHTNRPPLCINYPIYDLVELPKDYLFADEDCGYKTII